MICFQGLMVWPKHWNYAMSEASEAGFADNWIDQYEFVPFLATPSDLRLCYRI
jgi:hypothetical protein